MRGIVTLGLLAVLVAMIFTNRDSGPGFATVAGLAGAAVGYFFKK